MVDQSFIQVRVDNKLKQEAIAVLDDIGMDMPNAIRMFLKRIVLERGLPFDAKLPADFSGGNAVPRVEVIPAMPSRFIPAEEWIGLLSTVPSGRITRIVDIEALFCKKYCVPRVTLDQSPVPYNAEIPYWRLVSTRGMLQDVAYRCSKERQHEMLGREGLKIISCGAYNRSMKVENYKEHLFDFGDNVLEVIATAGN